MSHINPDGKLFVITDFSNKVIAALSHEEAITFLEFAQKGRTNVHTEHYNDMLELSVRNGDTLMRIRQLFKIPQEVATIDFLTGFLREVCKHTVRDLDEANNRLICRYCGHVDPMPTQHQQVLEEDGAAQTFEEAREKLDKIIRKFTGSNVIDISISVLNAFQKEPRQFMTEDQVKRFNTIDTNAICEVQDKMIAQLRKQVADVDERVRQEVQHATDVMGVELNKLRDFKQRVHDILDDQNVPKFENEDCRISHRLKDVFYQMKLLRERLKMIKRTTDGL